MPRDPSARIEAGLAAIIPEFLPRSSPPDDKELVQQKREAALALSRKILEQYGPSPDDHSIDQVSDMIRRKFWRDYDEPEKAVQFGNLFSRLLTLPILNRKKEIILLLHHLSEPLSADGSPRSQSPPSRYESQAFTDKRTESRFTEVRERHDSRDDGGRLEQQPQSEPKARVRAQSDAPGKGRGDIEGNADEEQANGVQPPDDAVPSEPALLRDLPFTLQGLSSTNFPFESTAILSLPPNLPLPIISLLHTLAEPSLLYRSLSQYVQSKEQGLISQSLRAAIGIELRSYLGLIATLEGEIRRTVASLEKRDDAKSATKIGVTLKRCVVWTREATMGLRLMSVMAEESKSKKGGQLITMIHYYSTSHGDPFVSTFAERMLVHLTKPFYNMLRQWIYDGELSDPYQEFFVIEQSPDDDTRDLDARRVPASSVWETKYKLDKNLIPSIITDDFAKKIFLIGKSLNFIRYGCGDSAWVEAYSKDTSRELKYGDTSTLESSISSAYKTTMARLIHLMDSKFHLFTHLSALKRYLLLGQGDFIALLMESLASNLDRPAGSQYRHTLTAQLDHAIRGSNAQFDSPDVLRRLDARLLELSHGDIGWDVFTLEYRVDAPVDVVVTAWANRQYLVVFNFLWRIKRVEFALGSTWRRLMTGARGILAINESVSRKLGGDWKMARATIAEMTHFVNQLQYYILFEVIEASWDALQSAIHRPDATLDDIVAAHTTYLNSITHKGLLGAARSSLTGQREDSFLQQLHYLLKVMLAYRDAVDGLYSFSVAESVRSRDFSALTQDRRRRHSSEDFEGNAGGGDLNSPLIGDRQHHRRAASRLANTSAESAASERDTDSPVPGAAALAALSSAIGGSGAGSNSAAGGLGDESILSALRARMAELAAEFRSRLATLLGDLLAQPDPDMKFLGVVMNFNDVYRPVRRKRREREGKEREKDERRKEEKGKGKEKERETPAPLPPSTVGRGGKN